MERKIMHERPFQNDWGDGGFASANSQWSLFRLAPCLITRRNPKNWQIGISSSGGKSVAVHPATRVG
jgi:hypothetical protein